MKYNPLTNQAFAALANGLPVPLTVTMESTGSATAWICGNKLYVLCAAAAASAYVNISTPIDLDILNVETRHDNSTGCSVQCLNTGDAISDDITVAASDTDIDRATEIDDDYNSFAAGDDDLRFEITTAAFTGLITCLIDK